MIMSTPEDMVCIISPVIRKFQCSGGNHTDWQDVAESWYDVGFPIAIIDESGKGELQ